MSYVELRSLYKIYKQGQNEVFALNGLSAVIEKGEFLAILGPSGSGKSTLFKLLMDDYHLQGGKIKCLTKTGNEAEVKDNISLVP